MGPLLCNQLPVPAKDGVWRDDRCDFGKGASSDGLAPHGKPSALMIGQSEPSAAELLLENTVFLLEVLDDRILLTADPTGHSSDEDLPGVKDNGHPIAAPPPDTQRGPFSQVRFCCGRFCSPVGLRSGSLERREGKIACPPYGQF